MWGKVGESVCEKVEKRGERERSIEREAGRGINKEAEAVEGETSKQEGMKREEREEEESTAI